MRAERRPERSGVDALRRFLVMYSNELWLKAIADELQYQLARQGMTEWWAGSIARQVAERIESPAYRQAILDGPGSEAHNRYYTRPVLETTPPFVPLGPVDS